jgi:hypothetical protein
MRQKRKLLSLFFIVCLIGIMFLSFINLTNASTFVIASYTGTVSGTKSVGIQDIYPSANYESGFGQSFEINTSGNLTKIGLMVYKSGNPNGTISAYLFNITGTYGISGMADKLLAVSNSIDVSSITTVANSWLNFTFPISVNMTTGEHYGVHIVMYSGQVNAYPDLIIGAVVDGANYGDCWAYYTPSTPIWHRLTDRTMLITVYGSEFGILETHLAFTLTPNYESGSTGSNWIMKQQQSYNYLGIVIEGGFITMIGNYSVYSTGLSIDSDVAVTGIYSVSSLNNVNFYSGSIIFNFFPRNSATLAYEGIRIDFNLTDGNSGTVTYSLMWQLATVPTPIPKQTFNPPHLAESWFGLTDMVLVGNIIVLMMIFLMIMLPLAYYFGNIGLFLGLMFATIATLFSGLMPLWGAILLFLGIFLLVWQQFGSNLGMPSVPQIPVRQTVKKVRNRFINEKVTED